MNNYYSSEIDSAITDTLSDDGITPDSSFTDSITNAGMADEFYNTYKGINPVRAFGDASSPSAMDFADGDIGGLAFQTAFRTNGSNSAGLETRRLDEAFMELGGTYGFSAESFGAGPNGITSVNFDDAQTSDLINFSSYVATLSSFVLEKLTSQNNVDSYNIGLNAVFSTLLSRGYSRNWMFSRWTDFIFLNTTPMIS